MVVMWTSQLNTGVLSGVLGLPCAWHQIRNVPGKDGAPGHGSGVGPN